tara:strand:- start:20697 stop:20960 length:264 start_codon:yes stop_codon:yes gene_type:complete
MTQKEMIEMVQQHHPESGETLIRKALNRAQDDFGARTKMIEAVADDTLVAGKRYYDLDPSMLDIKRVEVDNIAIKRLLNKPIEGDIT